MYLRYSRPMSEGILKKAGSITGGAKIALSDGAQASIRYRVSLLCSNVLSQRLWKPEPDLRAL